MDEGVRIEGAGGVLAEAETAVPDRSAPGVAALEGAAPDGSALGGESAAPNGSAPGGESAAPNGSVPGAEGAAPDRSAPGGESAAPNGSVPGVAALEGAAPDGSVPGAAGAAPNGSVPGVAALEGVAPDGSVPGAEGAAPNESVPGVAALEGAAPDGSVPGTPKGKGLKGKVIGCLEMAAAMGLAALGGWMFYHTRGTRLLYVDVVFGRVCRFYWIALMGAMVFFAVGLYTLKRSRKEGKKHGKLE